MTEDRVSVLECPSCGRKNRLRSGAPGHPRCGACHAEMPWIVEATPGGGEKELRCTLPVLVDFWAPWCGPCRMVTPLVARLAAEQAGRMKVVEVNVDEAPEIAARRGVQGIPLLVLFRDGAEVDRLVGAVPYTRLREWLEPHVAEPAPRG